MEENSFMASRERDDAMAGLLKRNLAGDADGGNDCPGPDILAAYFERSLDAHETARIELHLSECAHCREQLAALDRAAEAAAAPAAHAPRKAPRASWVWDWRWLAPVAAVLVLAAVWATRRPALTRIAEEPTQAPAAVATSLPAQQPSQPAAQQTTRQDKQEPLSRLTSPPPKPVSVTPRAAPPANSGAGFGVPAATAENSPPANLATRKSIPLDELSKKAATEQQASADQAANVPSPAGTSESVTVESAVPTVATPSAPAAGSPAARPKANEALGGVAGGAISAGAGSAKSAKQERVATSGFRAQTEIVTTTQARELSTAHIIPTPDTRIFWRIASGGFIERSEDGGATWNGTQPDPNAHFVAGSAPSAKVCWLVGDNGVILLTQDASNWQVILPPVRADFVAVSARNASSAAVTSADGRKFETTNRGKTWKPAE
jgi:hypothetical protein